MGSEVFWKNVIHTVILAFKKKPKNFVLREFCKRTHCPPVVTLALLLFLQNDGLPSYLFSTTVIVQMC